ncbi:radical SAM family heme chaperone HemW [Sneathiella sp. HT1-7]|jgi:oxygen-independent coproporphyrinogen-3 oxidase|uniref:radical SAM family heme chaperone HemW n=1 Tax=Sneathiella sp. HT1-7 TaxID=2887192 RepID=UPI001D1567BB|nr:radical SAM family heme chaperone HemW [Sneathiella sp. HT1-7]MCC3304086.1 radical SAM family heme chaperone HemW [Sneathiella sp. HT1-7]
MPALAENSTPDPGFGLYFHWPFCRKKCPYCDFNSHVREAVDQHRWTAALLRELDYFADQTTQKSLTSIFFGGGTPSLMTPETVAALIEGARSRFTFADDIEISLEANPTSVEASSFAGYGDAGVTRLSLGVQSMRDEALKFLGREHTAGEALQAIELARKSFANISFDLIYALPGQSVADWRSDLERALILAGDHLSLYQLTIEPNTGFAGAVRRGEFAIPVEENAEELFEVTQNICADAGRPAYEISNHARPGYECRHNLTYWRYGEYIGVGPGAHGRAMREGVRTAFQQKKRPESWLEAVETAGHGTDITEPLIHRLECAEEMLLMGLRLDEGVWFENFSAAIGAPMQEFLRHDRLASLVEAGLMEMDDQKLRATERGRLVLNSLLPEILV